VTNVRYIDMDIMLSRNTNIYGHFYFLKGLSLAIVYEKHSQLRGILIVSFVIFYKGAKLGDLLTVSVKLVKNFMAILHRTVK
jgi:hypothetical protein